MTIMMAAAGSSTEIFTDGVVTVSAENVIDIASTNRQYTATVIYRLDGTLDAVVNTTTTQRNASTDWIIPNSASESQDYEIRYTGLTGTALTFASSTEDTWVDLNGDKTYRLQDSLTAFQNFDSNFTIEIRINGGAVIDSGAISLSIEHLGF